jgi:hypothetical protein
MPETSWGGISTPASPLADTFHGSAMESETDLLLALR